MIVVTSSWVLCLYYNGGDITYSVYKMIYKMKRVDMTNQHPPHNTADKQEHKLLKHLQGFSKPATQPISLHPSNLDSRFTILIALFFIFTRSCSHRNYQFS
ncbi:hypothetical protein L1987_55489 [Smallanthus sonchifolius]|uniref:Uncharacterized protein n=1 Tax=Smallanthus sonchifolius TaxID=185202 RepID=A0ACB9EAS4_9ASTR|nr:hypothetical protein L1987_55489 [Smallanthus sonchifolius]